MGGIQFHISKYDQISYPRDKVKSTANLFCLPTFKYKYNTLGRTTTDTEVPY